MSWIIVYIFVFSLSNNFIIRNNGNVLILLLIYCLLKILIRIELINWVRIFDIKV